MKEKEKGPNKMHWQTDGKERARNTSGLWSSENTGWLVIEYQGQQHREDEQRPKIKGSNGRFGHRTTKLILEALFKSPKKHKIHFRKAPILKAP